MGLLSKLRGNSNPRRESKLRFQSDEVAQQRKRSVRAKASKDVMRAKRAARRKAAEVKSKTKEDVRRGARRARSELEADRRTPGNVSAPKTTREIFQLAGDSAQLRSPVDATLDPSPDGPMMEAFATNVSDPSGGTESGEGMLDAGFITGEEEPFHDANDSGDGDGVDQNQLEFSDDFGAAGGTWL